MFLRVSGFRSILAGIVRKDSGGVAGKARHQPFRALYSSLRRRVEENPQLMGLRLYVERSNHRAQAVYEVLGMSREHYDLYEWLRD